MIVYCMMNIVISIGQLEITLICSLSKGGPI